MEVWCSHFLVSSTLEKTLSIPFNKSIIQLVDHSGYFGMSFAFSPPSCLTGLNKHALWGGLWAEFLGRSSCFSLGWLFSSIMHSLMDEAQSSSWEPLLESLETSFPIDLMISIQVVLKLWQRNQGEMHVLFLPSLAHSIQCVHLNTYGVRGMILDTRDYSYKSGNCLALKQLHSSQS